MLPKKELIVWMFSFSFATLSECSSTIFCVRIAFLDSHKNVGLLIDGSRTGIWEPQCLNVF